MKKFRILCAFQDKAQYAGEKPYTQSRQDYIGDYVEADDSAEAVDFAIDYSINHIINSKDGVNIERTDDEIRAFDESGKVVEYYYNFTAIEK